MHLFKYVNIYQFAWLTYHCDILILAVVRSSHVSTWTEDLYAQGSAWSISWALWGLLSDCGGREWKQRARRNGGSQTGEKEKNERGKEEWKERAEEWRWWVHVWARGCWSIPGSVFPDRLNGKGQRVSFPMKEGLSETRLIRLLVCRFDAFETFSRTHVQTDDLGELVACKQV